MSICGYAEVNYTLNTDLMSKYIWRGQNLNDRSVFQPSISVSDSNFTGSIWGNQNWTGVNDHSGEFTEFDYSLDYTHAIPGIDWLSGSAGMIYYTFPNTDFASTTEVYGGLTLTNVPLSPSIKIYRDVDEIKGTYYQLSVGHTLEKFYKWNEQCYCDLAFGASLGYGNSTYDKGYSLADSSQFNDLTLSLGLPICYGKWTIKPSVNYSTMLSEEVRQNTVKSDNAWVGLGISTNF